MTASAGPALRRLHRMYGDRVSFLTVYVREAHPGERYPQPDTMTEKIAHARAYQQRDHIGWPIAVDDLGGSFHRAVDPKPSSVYFVDVDGRIVFRALWSNDTAGLEQGFETLLAKNPARHRGERAGKLGPIMRGLGSMDDVLGASGDVARRDFRRALPPVYALSKVAGIFRPLPPLGRAIAATALVAAATVVAGIVGWRTVRSPA